MASKIYTTELKVGMFVADLDRPWVDTPFLLQGFLVENQEQILALKTHCEYVIVDRARSTGDQFEAPTAAAIAVARDVTQVTPPQPVETKSPARARSDSPARITRFPASVPYRARRPDAGGNGAHEEGLFGRLFGRLTGGKRGNERETAVPPPEIPRETPQEFAARAELLPPGVQVQTYVDRVSVEEEVPRAQAAVEHASSLMDNLVRDIRLGQSFEIERVEEIVGDMVESVVRNPDAAMWIARLRQEDIATYGHGLQVSV
ncbi:MAG TPA: DUF3391 domain-containing protein, partial [Usitatibacter sp.]|nr:DUF3391 domain-containing protein [Usitatibacter sp.]